MSKGKPAKRACRWLLAGAIAGCGTWLSVSCGGSSRTGTDSQTHWLSHCESDSDCGVLRCACGVCTEPCTDTSDCSAFGALARCGTPGRCSADGENTCQLACEEDRDCETDGEALLCDDGFCAPPASLPMDPDPCAAMDAESNGDDCLQVVGYAFNGTLCYPVVCGCQGNDCNELYESSSACDAAFSACYAELGVERGCETNADCTLVPRACCGANTEPDAVLAISGGGAVLQDELCDGQLDCPTIFIPPKPSLYAQCVEGQCETLDVAPVAACETDGDCAVRSKGCCNCPMGESPAELLAVALPDEYYDFASCQVECDLCLDMPPEGITAICDQDFGLCALSEE